MLKKIAGLAAFGLLLLISYLLYVIHPRCDITIFHAQSSPNKKYSAVVFDRNCSATTGISHQVSIVPSWRNPWGSGNILISDEAPEYTPSFNPVWSGDNEITVPIPPMARVFRQNSEFNGIEVKFKQM